MSIFRRKFASSAVMKITIWLLLFGWARAQGITRVPQDFPTIQAAIDNGPYTKSTNPLPGWPAKQLEIQIGSGTYNESLTLKGGNIVLKAVAGSQVLINGSAEPKPFVSQGPSPSYFEASGIVFTNFAWPRGKADAVFINTSGSNFFYNCTFINNQGSLFAANGSLTFKKCVFTNNYVDNIFNGGNGAIEIIQCHMDCSASPSFYTGMNMPLLVTNSIVTSIGSTILGGWGTRHLFINSTFSFQGTSKNPPI